MASVFCINAKNPPILTSKAIALTGVNFMQFEKTETFSNLARSFAGECQAGMRYQMIAKLAMQEKLKTLADAVRTIAKNETVHATQFFNKILQYAGEVLRRLPAEVSATVNRNGVYLSGGLMRLSGLPQYIASRLEMRYHLHENPQYATVEGATAVVCDKELLNYFAKDLNE